MKKAWKLTCGELEELSLEEAVMPFRRAALVGGGGKTSLMYALADGLAAHGFRTALTTTTHMMPPENMPMCRCLEDCEARWCSGFPALWCRDTGGEKLEGLPEQEFRQLLRADRLLVEADGAKRLPCKVPAAHEPVIPPEADLVLGVVGLSAWNRPLGEVCFRWELAADRLNCGPDRLLTAEAMAELLAAPWGGRKSVGDRRYLAVLNQGDDPEAREIGRQILLILRDKFGVDGIITCLQGEEHE